MKSQHAEWLSLLDVSGPFLSPPVLERVFPQGLDEIANDLIEKLRLAHDEWSEEHRKYDPDPAIHDQWIRFVLAEALFYTPDVLYEGQGIPAGLSVFVSEHDETLRPHLVLCDPSDIEHVHRPRLLIEAHPAGTDLDQPVAGSAWAASPLERMAHLCRETGVRLGLVTNGERWVLVDAPRGETSAFVSWYAELWSQEPLTLRAFVSLLGARRFFGVAEEDRLEAMLAESASYQAEVTDTLGAQVRQAVEVLVQALDRADADTGRRLLREVPATRIYEAALTVMMRLVFLFFAEENRLLPIDDRRYAENYAASTLYAQLQSAADQVGVEVLERRQDAWCRLLATFRAIHGGVSHGEMRLPGYGGSLFDPDRFPFLEGRQDGTTWRDTLATPLPVDNRTVLLLLRSLQLLDLGRGRGARRLSFRALDIEQIGHVYESLLDHTARRATEPMLGLQGNKKLQPEVPVSALIQASLKSDDGLVEFLNSVLAKPRAQIQKALEKPPAPEVVASLQTACGDDKVLLGRVLPFHALIRRDAWGDPVVILQGSVFVTEGQDRRSTGTHYTPRALTEEIVRYALEPLVYEGPAAGLPPEEWELKRPSELLDLKICDPAMGSGAFLVQACRYLSERLVEAWERIDPGGPITPEGEPATRPEDDVVPDQPDERLAFARRLVAERCLYGVDVNPLAVEMAKLSLWLVTLARDAPFTFLDHALKCGDSLLGVHDRRQFTHFAMDTKEAARVDEGGLFADFSAMEAALRDAAEAREVLAQMSDRDIFDIEAKTKLFEEAEALVDDARLVGDVIAALEIARSSMPKGAYLDARLVLADQVREYLDTREPELRETLARRVRTLIDTELPEGKPHRRPFHWPVEFPEVFGKKSGFDSMVTNPPFLGGKRISGTYGSPYREYLSRCLGRGVRGNADLAAFFFLRLAELTNQGGTFGAIATNTIGQGDTREVGLDQLVAEGWTIYRAEPTRSWPGGAAVEVSILWLTTLGIPTAILAGEEVSGIGSDLEVPISAGDRPRILMGNAGIAFQGTIVLGKGFMLDPEVAERLIALDPRNREVLKPYINGKDLNSRPDLSPSRWAIDFDDMSEDEARTYAAVWEIALRDIKPDRQAKNAAKYPTMVEFWWKHWNRREELYEAIRGRERALAVTRVSSTLAFVFLPTDLLYSDAIVVFALDRWGDFATLQSIFHDLWVRRFTSSLKGDVRYTATDAFETFPRPEPTQAMEEAGEAFYTARQELMLGECLGLTDVHNRVNDPDDRSDEIERLRELWSAMDHAVAEAYGWADLRLERVFRTHGGRRRWTLTAAEETEVLTRLLRLNHGRARIESG
jgi:hypothetical protein